MRIHKLEAHGAVACLHSGWRCEDGLRRSRKELPSDRQKCRPGYNFGLIRWHMYVDVLMLKSIHECHKITALLTCNKRGSLVESSCKRRRYKASTSASFVTSSNTLKRCVATMPYITEPLKPSVPPSIMWVETMVSPVMRC